MKSSYRSARLPLIAAAGILVLICTAFEMSSIAQALPTDAHANNPGCAVSLATFDSWFNLKLHAPNGLVDPADSVNFIDTTTVGTKKHVPVNCPFYEWSEQMFLWLTSPVFQGPVFRTATFFDVSPPDPDATKKGARTFIPHPSPGVLNVEQNQARGNNTFVLQPQTTANGSLVYYMTTVNDVYAFFATGVKQQNPLNKHFNPTPTHFPTGQIDSVTGKPDVDAVVQFANDNQVSIPDSKALAIMVKSAWVLASSLPNPSNYITITATVPTYDTSLPANWVFNGTQTVQLALVGMHVVGSVNGDPALDPIGHPEMVWATFEHEDNAPRAQYQYINNNTIPAIVTVSPVFTVPSLFTAANATTFNVPHMATSLNSPLQPNVQTVNGFKQVSPSDTIRWKPFGATSNAAPNPLALDLTGKPSAAASNTEIISINNSVIGPLTSADVRSHYVMTGATWTIAGMPNAGLFQKKGAILGAEVGTSLLQNATIETYNQGTDTLLTSASTANGGQVANCFSCHNVPDFTSANGLNVSRDFLSLLPMTSFTPNEGYILSSFPNGVLGIVDDFVPFVFLSSQISVVPFKGFTGSVALSASGLPPGASAFFSRDPTTGTSMLTLAVGPRTPPGVSTILIKGTSGNSVSFAAVTLTVQKKNK